MKKWIDALKREIILIMNVHEVSLLTLGLLALDNQLSAEDTVFKIQTRSEIKVLLDDMLKYLPEEETDDN